MSGLDEPLRTGGYRFTERDFDVIAGLAKSTFGLHLGPGKMPLVYSRLVRRLRARGLSSFADYCLLLEEPGEAAERDSMVSALATNVTHFFREAHHFDLLSREVLPPLLDRARSGGRVRLWSAGCSTGQEPFSIASTILELCPDAPRLDLRILASDVDTVALAQGEAGSYGPDATTGLAPLQRMRLFGPAAGTNSSVRPELRELVAFRPLNLLEDWPMPGRFDVIFCRNVAIYFDKPTQQRLWSRLADRIPPGGVLLIGHSEQLSGQAASLFTSAGVTAHRRRAATPTNPEGNAWD